MTLAPFIMTWARGDRAQISKCGRKLTSWKLSMARHPRAARRGKRRARYELGSAQEGSFPKSGTRRPWAQVIALVRGLLNLALCNHRFACPYRWP